MLNISTTQHFQDQWQKNIRVKNTKMIRQKNKKGLAPKELKAVKIIKQIVQEIK